MTTRRAWLLLGTSALLSLVGCGRPPELGLAPGQWEFGELDGGAPAVQEITVSNPGRGTEVRFVTVDGAGHAWMGHESVARAVVGAAYEDLDASAVIVEFLLSHSRT